MFVVLSIIFSLFIWYFLIYNNQNYEECVVEDFEQVSQGQIILSDPTGNLSTFNVGSGKTLVSDSSGNITTIQTGLFNDVTSNNGITSVTGTFNGLLKANGGLTGTTATLSGPLNANGATLSGQLNANGGLTGTTATLSGSLNANGGISGTTATLSGALNANGGLTGTTATLSGPLNANGGIIGTTATLSGVLNANGGIIGNASTSSRNLVADTRNDNQPPSYYAARSGIMNEFKNGSTIGLPNIGFVWLQTTTSWADNSAGIPIKQTAFNSKNAQYVRYAMPQDAAWGAWENSAVITNIGNGWTLDTSDTHLRIKYNGDQKLVVHNGVGENRLWSIAGGYFSKGAVASTPWSNFWT